MAQRLADREGARLRVVADRSLFIESSIREVRDGSVELVDGDDVIAELRAVAERP